LSILAVLPVPTVFKWRALHFGEPKITWRLARRSSEIYLELLADISFARP